MYRWDIIKDKNNYQKMNVLVDNKRYIKVDNQKINTVMTK